MARNGEQVIEDLGRTDGYRRLPRQDRGHGRDGRGRNRGGDTSNRECGYGAEIARLLSNTIIQTLNVIF